MNKRDVFLKAKNYCNVLKNTIVSNKKKKKENAGHLIFKKSDNGILVGLSTFAISIGLGFLLCGVKGLAANIGLPVATGSAVAVSFVLPKTIRALLMKSKGRFGRGYAKMELDDMFIAMNEEFKKIYKDLLVAENENEVSNEELKSFVKQTYYCAQNYKHDLDKYVGKKIYEINKKDYNKLVSLIKNKSPEQFNTKKINKILESNKKKVESWCELFNKCGAVSKKLFEFSADMNPNFEIPSDNSFVADKDFVNKKFNKYLKDNKIAIQVKKDISFEKVNNDIKERERNIENKIKSQTEIKNKISLNDAIL